MMSVEIPSQNTVSSTLADHTGHSLVSGVDSLKHLSSQFGRDNNVSHTNGWDWLSKWWKGAMWSVLMEV